MVGMSVIMGRLILHSPRHLDEGMHLVEVEVQIEVEVQAEVEVQTGTIAVVAVQNLKGLSQERGHAVSSAIGTMVLEALESYR